MNKEDGAKRVVELLKGLYQSSVMRDFHLFAYGEMAVLAYLANDAAQPKLPSEISQQTSVSPARVAAILGQLEKKQLIQREIMPDDRRKILVKITSQGLKKAAEEHELAHYRMLEIFEGMRDDEVEALLTGLEAFQNQTQAPKSSKQSEKK